jgi:hypothetical protein
VCGKIFNYYSFPVLSHGRGMDEWKAVKQFMPAVEGRQAGCLGSWHAVWQLYMAGSTKTAPSLNIEPVL